MGDVGIGVDTPQLAAVIRGGDASALPPYQLSDGSIALGAVHVSIIDRASALARRVVRIT